jgi:hypothetical protein
VKQRIKTRYLVSAACVLALGALILMAGHLFCDKAPVERRRVEKSVHLAARYLVRATMKDGMFQYRLNMNPKVKLRKKYNILRHAGTLFAMAAYQQRFPDGEMLAAVKRAGAYLRDEAIHPVEGEQGVLAVWSNPEVNGTGKPRQAKLGATGLGLVALLSIDQLEPGFTPLETLRQLGRFIIRMQKADGDFYSKFLPQQGGFNDKWRSLYYPGEAALGLMMLHGKDPSNKWRQAAIKALTYLATVREGKRRVPADHWALLATEAVLISEGATSGGTPRGRLIAHASQICESILAEQRRDLANEKLSGGFTKDGRTAPAATRIEGLQAALGFLPKGHALRRPIARAVDRGMAFLLATQVDKGPFSGAIPRAAVRLDGEGKKIEKRNRRASEVRIDYVQHYMSAAMQYLDRQR